MRFLTLLCLVSLFSLFEFNRNLEAPKKKQFPNEWFFIERAFPYRDIEQVELRRAYSQSRQFFSRFAADGGEWETTGPDNVGGRITDIEISPTNPSIIFVATAAGGVFRSQDGGRSFSAQFDQESSLSIGDIALDPNDPNTVWVGSGEANPSASSYPGMGIFLSDDGGNHWRLMGLPESRHIGRIVVHPNDSNTLWAAAMGNLYSPGENRGLYRTRNRGKTWKRVLFLNESTGVIDVALNPLDPNTLYAATWERMRTPTGFTKGGRGSGIFKSTDGGDSWIRLSNGLSEPLPTTGRIGLSLCATQPSVLYAIFDDIDKHFNGVYKSTDAGSTWTRTNDTGLNDMYLYFGWWFGNIRVDPKDPKLVYALGLNAYKSNDGGGSWSNFTRSIHVDHHALAIDSGNSKRIFSGNDGGFYSSVDGGNSWSGPVRLPVTQFYDIAIDPTRPQRLYGGTQDNGTVRTLTGGHSDWTRILGGDGFYVVIDPNRPETIYAEAQFGALAKSTNGGGSFSSIAPNHNRANWNTPILLDPNNSNVIYYGAERLFRSQNGGGSWTAISPDLSSGPYPNNLNFGTISTISVSKVDSRVIYGGTDDGNVWVTRDLGSNWKKINSTLPRRWVTRVLADTVTAGRVFATFSGFKFSESMSHIYLSEDYGDTWQSIRGNLPDIPINVVRQDSTDLNTLYIGTDFGVFVTRDRGENWAPLGSGLPVLPVLDLAIDETNHRIIAGTHGRSMYSLSLAKNLENSCSLRQAITLSEPAYPLDAP